MSDEELTGAERAPRMEFPPNEPIPLEDDVCLRVATGSGGKGESFRGRALLRLAHRPGLEVRSSSEVKNWTLPNDAVLKRPSSNDEAFFATSMKQALGGNGLRAEVTWSPRRQRVLIPRSDDAAREIRFHVVNFPCFYGEGDEIREGPRGGVSRHGRVKAQLGPWIVDLREGANLRQMAKELDASQGFGLTHQGHIVRSDGGPIDTEEACEFLDALEAFLSFARGNCCSLGLVEARSETERVAWERWGCGRVDPWSSSTSWFDSEHGEILEEALPLFWRVWSAGGDKQAALHHAIYWYLRSDTRHSVDGGLILMQAALERLAHTFCRPKVKPPKREYAALRLERALRKWKIPVDLPSNCKSLTAHMNAVKSGTDARRATLAVTELRNNAVHPEKTPVPSGAYYEAWQLARWFIELSVLSVIDYQGDYANRLTQQVEGEVEAVPWAPTT